MAAILIIEDDARVRSALARAMERSGHAVATAATAMDGLRIAVAEKPEVVVLDLGLPDLDGVELLRMLRPVSDAVVIVATARVAEAEIIRTLDAGADDYVCKPFSPDQLDARIRACLRRFGSATGDSGRGVLTVGGLRIDARAREATLDGRTLELSRKEFDLLHVLAQRSGQVVSKRELLAEVWRQPFFHHRQDRRRPHLMAAAQARGDRRPSEVPARGAGRRHPALSALRGRLSDAALARAPRAARQHAHRRGLLGPARPGDRPPGA